MSFLALDVGNTRLKWALYDTAIPSAKLLAHGAEFLENIDTLAEGAWSELPAPQHILGCIVAGDHIRRRVMLQLELWDAVPQWVIASAQEAGLSNGYDHPTRLGADRWVAMIGARQRMLAQGPARPLVVVMVGTAVTVEAIDAEGRFLGGLILPGHGIMLRALESGTAGLHVPTGEVQEFPTNTSDATWETVLDIDALNTLENANWVWKGADCIEPKQDRCLISLSRGGGDAVEVREFDIASKAFVKDGFVLPEAKSATSWKDRDTLFIGTDFPGSNYFLAMYPSLTFPYIGFGTFKERNKYSIYGIDGGLSFGLNLNLGDYVTLGLEAGVKYGYNIGSQDRELYYTGNPLIPFNRFKGNRLTEHGIEGYGSFAFMFRFVDTYQ